MGKHIAAEDRLDILRAADKRRKWSSLDARRFCTRCNRFIAGRQIEIRRNQRGHFLLRCPTPNCASTVEEWFYLGNGTSRESVAAARRAEVSSLL